MHIFIPQTGEYAEFHSVYSAHALNFIPGILQVRTVQLCLNIYIFLHILPKRTVSFGLFCECSQFHPEYTTYAQIDSAYFGVRAKINLTIKGSVQRKLRWVQNGVVRRV
jgi:hypothetical protein